MLLQKIFNKSKIKLLKNNLWFSKFKKTLWMLGNIKVKVPNGKNSFWSHWASLVRWILCSMKRLIRKSSKKNSKISKKVISHWLHTSRRSVKKKSQRILDHLPYKRVPSINSFHLSSRTKQSMTKFKKFRFRLK